MATVNTYRVTTGTGSILILNGTGIAIGNQVPSTTAQFNNAILSNDEAGEIYLAIGTNAVRGQGILVLKAGRPFRIDKRLNPLQAPVYMIGTTAIQALAIQVW